MTTHQEIIEPKTKRLILRQWRDSDFAAFAALNADPRVMEHFPATLNRQESDELAQRLQALIAERGWGLWAVQTRTTTECIGFVGLAEQTIAIPNAPLVEIGWRLAYDSWSQGYATEAAQAALKVGFERLRLDAIYSFTALSNKRSGTVMRKLGMINTGEDFDHPKLPKGHPLERHCLYRITRAQWDTLAI